MTRFDAETLSPLEVQPYEPPLSDDTIAEVRAMLRRANPSFDEVAAGLDIEAEEHTAPGPNGEVELTILRPKGRHTLAGTEPLTRRAAVLNFHGGGMVMDDRHADYERLVPLVRDLDLIAITVEYRLAPENPDPAPVEDCYAALAWVSENAVRLGIDPARIVVMGGSAGGGLAAGVSLLARDREGPRITGQMLLCPMLDDREQTTSAKQFESIGTWKGPNNRFGWKSLLGKKAGDPTAEISIYAAPARATDLSNLPPAFIEVGAAELFRDEDVSYASNIWATGGEAELHVWSGGYHGFDRIAPEARVSRAAIESRTNWLRRTLQLP